MGTTSTTATAHSGKIAGTGLTKVSSWGGPGTPFQLEGKPPVTRKAGDEGLWGYAGGDLGFYGYLRVADRTVLRATLLGIMDLPDHRWAEDYAKRRHPVTVASRRLSLAKRGLD